MHTFYHLAICEELERRKLIALNPNQPAPNLIMQKVIRNAVTNTMQVSWEELAGKSRLGKFVTARQMYCYLMYEYGKATLEAIGAQIERDHTTVIHSVRKIKNMVKQKDAIYLPIYNKCIRAINMQ